MSLSLLDWRRRVSEIYADVRSRSASSPAEAHARWGAGRDALFGGHPQSPLLPGHRAGFAGLPVAPYDPAYRFEVFVADVDPEPLQVQTGTDGVVRFERMGRVELAGLGTLDLWWLQGYGGGLFVPFRDGTSAKGGYGGGRYLLDTVKGADLGTTADGVRLVLDLNFAYHPSCAYDPAWACPLAPLGNRLVADVPVGELYEGPWATAP
jgi:uncharacterized protein